MEIRRVADVLLRCQPSPFTYHVTPPSSASFSVSRRNRPMKTARSFTSSTRRWLRMPPPTTSATPPTEPKTNSIKIKEFKELFAGRSREPSSYGPKRNTESILNGGASDKDIQAAWRREKGSSSTSGSSFDRMLLPKSNAYGRLASISDPVHRELKEVPKLPPMRLSPSTGRTVSVGGKVDVTRAFSLLAMSVQRNGIKRESSRQRFHERPGLKRKRLHSYRWRRRFRAGFKAAVARVVQLRKQGW